MLVRDKGPRTLPNGKRPEDRSMEELLSAGVIVLDKVQGPTSHQVTRLGARYPWCGEDRSRRYVGPERQRRIADSVGKGDTNDGPCAPFR